MTKGFKHPSVKAAAPLILSLICVTFSNGWADVVTDGAEGVRGTVVRVRAEGCTALDMSGKVHSFGKNVLKSMKIDFTAGGRPAEVTIKVAKESLWTINSQRGDVLTGLDAEGHVAEAKISRLKDCILYPAGSARKVLPIDYVEQKPDFCGEACVEMVTSYLGARISQDKANQLAGLTEERGVYSNELERVVHKAGLITEPLMGSRMGDADDALADRLRLVRSIASNHPVILGIWGDAAHKTNETKWNFDHFVLLVGFDLTKRQMLIHDPARKALRELTFEQFETCRKNRSDVAYSITVRPIRTWTKSDGGNLRGEFVEGVDDAVILRTDDGKDRRLKLKELSKSDQKFIAHLRPEQPQAPK